MRKVNEELTKFIFNHGYRNQLVEDRLNKIPKYSYNGIECGVKCNYEPLKTASGNIQAPQRHRPAFHISKPDPVRLAIVWLFDPSTEDLESFQKKAVLYGYNLRKNMADLSLSYNFNQCTIESIKQVYVLIYALDDYVNDNLKQVYKNDFVRCRRLVMSNYSHNVIAG